MLEKLANVFRIPDLRKRILFTLALLAVYRLGGHIPTPGVNADKLQQYFENNKGSLLGFVDLFSGGQLRRLTIFALGIMPYITWSMSRSPSYRRKANWGARRLRNGRAI